MRAWKRQPTGARSVTRAPWGIAAALIVAAACGKIDHNPAASVAVAPDTTLPAPAESLLAADPNGASIRRGLALLVATRDSLPSHVGNELHCSSCHLDKGRKPFGLPLVGVANRYPATWARTGASITLEARINDCFERSLNGKALDAKGADMRDLVAYMTWLSKDLAKGPHKGLGLDSVPLIAVDTVRGKTQYAMYCQRCHGADGEGGKALGVQNPGPPLWGKGSFGAATEFARQTVVASFLHHHMPFDAPGFVADSIANDVAGWILGRPRTDFAGKAKDYPNGGAPPDLAYTVSAAKAKPSAKP
jgi:thiosulfate dehydrogenase